MVSLLLHAVLLSCFLVGTGRAVTFSSRLIHRFSEEVKALTVVKNNATVGNADLWPQKRSMEYYQLLVSNDFQRQSMKLGSHYQLLFPSEGSKTVSFGNDFGWLHYTWIDVGTPKVPFLVALDAGSDLLWLPCECVQCAPLSASYYGSLDRDLNEYTPSSSSSSKHLACSHQLCELAPSCKSPKDSCPYNISYYTENTSSSGLLVEDVLHLASGSGNTHNHSVRAPIILGCGMRQSGPYLDGIAPDGLMGLGTGEISIPSLLAKAGLVRNSLSMCFDNDDSGSGRIFFGDLGAVNQKYTAFLPLNGKYETYIVGVEACCIGNSCLKQTSFNALVDSGSSFTYLPDEVFEKIAEEFDQRVNASRASIEGYPWKYCYKSREKPKVPSVTLVFPLNNSFVVHDPVFLIYGMEGIAAFCLAIQPSDGAYGTIGHNFMTGYRMVFDRDNLKLGWSLSDCQDLSDDNERTPLAPSGRPQNPLPSEQQSNTSDHDNAVAPAVAGRAPAKAKPSKASPQVIPSHCFLLRRALLLPLVLLLLVPL